MLPSSLLTSLRQKGSQADGGTVANRLRSVPLEDRRDRSAPSACASSLNQAATVDDDEVRNTFFHAGADCWYEEIANLTFTSTFCALTWKEAKLIVDHWQSQEEMLHQNPSSSCHDTELTHATFGQLANLVQRLDWAVKQETSKSEVGKAFVKLSTRSPKDSKKILAKAAKSYHQRISEMTFLDSNVKWRVLSEEVANASAIEDGIAALELLLDSARVYEDLKFALEGSNKEEDSDDSNWQVSLLARAWDPRLRPETEFRGICWNGKLTCLCQYFHPLYFPELTDEKDDIERDILQSFELDQVQAAISKLGGSCVIDFARVGPGEVLIIELNPFDGLALGCLPASTGLFLWDDPMDHKIMTGKAPFEFRIRENPIEEHKLKVDFHKGWRDIVSSTSASD